MIPTTVWIHCTPADTILVDFSSQLTNKISLKYTFIQLYAVTPSVALCLPQSQVVHLLLRLALDSVMNNWRNTQSFLETMLLKLRRLTIAAVMVYNPTSGLIQSR